jgi:hypothetical protein
MLGSCSSQIYVDIKKNGGCQGLGGGGSGELLLRYIDYSFRVMKIFGDEWWRLLIVIFFYCDPIKSIAQVAEKILITLIFLSMYLDYLSIFHQSFIVSPYRSCSYFIRCI